jgi:hypothetical protein
LPVVAGCIADTGWAGSAAADTGTGTCWVWSIAAKPVAPGGEAPEPLLCAQLACTGALLATALPAAAVVPVGAAAAAIETVMDGVLLAGDGYG